jgi:hypothetical protein
LNRKGKCFFGFFIFLVVVLCVMPVLKIPPTPL